MGLKKRTFKGILVCDISSLYALIWPLHKSLSLREHCGFMKSSKMLRVQNNCLTGVRVMVVFLCLCLNYLGLCFCNFFSVFHMVHLYFSSIGSSIIIIIIKTPYKRNEKSSKTTSKLKQWY